MATLLQQREIAEIERELKLLDEQEARLSQQQQPAESVAAPDAAKADLRSPTMGSSTGFYKPDPRVVSRTTPTSADGVGGFVADMAMEGGGATAGAMIGAIPALSVPTVGLSIPLGAAIGGLLGNAGGQIRRGKDYKIGEGVGAAISSAVAPGSGTVIRSGVKGLIRVAGKEAAANVGGVAAASLIDKGELPDPGEAAIAAVLGAGGSALGAAATSGKKVMAETKEALRNSERDWAMQLGSDVGYSFDAVKSNPNAVTNMVARIGGESEIHKAAIGNNQKVTNALVRQELGMPDDWPIGEKSIKRAVDDARAPYGKLRKLGTTADNLVSELENTRKLERDSWQRWRKEGGAELKESAVAAGQKAEALEADLELIAQASPSPGLVDELRQGREKLGKLYVVQIAGNLPAGNVDARILAAFNKEAPGKLTGGLKVAAMAAAIQPHMFKPAEKVIPATIRSGQVAGTLIGMGSGMTMGQNLGLGTLGTLAGGAMGAGAGMLAAGAAQGALTTPFQRLANSRTYQRALGVPRYQLDALEAIPTFLSQTTRSAGRPKQDDEAR